MTVMFKVCVRLYRIKTANCAAVSLCSGLLFQDPETLTVCMFLQELHLPPKEAAAGHPELRDGSCQCGQRKRCERLRACAIKTLARRSVSLLCSDVVAFEPGSRIYVSPQSWPRRVISWG
jgi:hypothetical protein